VRKKGEKKEKCSSSVVDIEERGRGKKLTKEK
jgi:hypothetical protein